MLKKLITYCLVVTTTVWGVGFLGLSVALGASDGDLVKKSNSSSVFYLWNGSLHPFGSAKVFNTWELSFTDVKTISDEEFSSYQLIGSSDVFVRPGMGLVQAVDGDTPWNIVDPKVYAVSGDGMLHHLTTASLAEQIFGVNWQAMIVPVPLSSFTQYSLGDPIQSLSDYDRDAELEASTTIGEVKGSGGSNTPAPGGNLTISLASDTPAANLIPSNTARVPFTKVNLTASASGDVVIDRWEVTRGGVGSSDVFTGVDILDEKMIPLSEINKTLNSNDVANFNEDFTIPAGTTRSVYLAGTFGSNASYAGEVVALGLKGVTLKQGGAINGSLPVYGNGMTINATLSIGTATVRRGAYSEATDTTLEVGQLNETFLAFSIQAGSAEDVWFQNIRVYQQGSASIGTDVTNFRLMHENTEIAKGVVRDSKYVDFVLTTPYKITEGQTKQFQVKADVSDGSGRTVDLGIYRTTDLLVKGEKYGFNITPTYTGTGTSSNSPVLSDNQHTISAGSLQVRRSAGYPSSNISVGSNQLLGSFEFEVKGESVEVTSLTLSVTSSTSGTIVEDALESVYLVNAATGETIAGPEDVTSNTTNVTFSSFDDLEVGKHDIEVRATVSQSGGWTSNDTIYASINPASQITARGVETGETITASPSAAINTTTQTVKTATLEVSANSTPTSQSVVPNTNSVLVASWQFDATDSGENIRVSSIAVRASSTAKYNNYRLSVDGQMLDGSEDAISSSSANATITFSDFDAFIIPKNSTVDINMYANIPSNSNSGEVDAYGITTGSAITAFGVSSGNTATVSVSASDGPALTTAGAGTLTVDLDNIAAPQQLLVAGSTGVALTDVNLKANNEDVKITKLTVRVDDGGLTGTAAGNYEDISKFYLKLDGQIIGNTDGYTITSANRTVNLETGALTVPEGDNNDVTLSILGDLVNIGTNLPGTANADIKVGLVGIDDAAVGSAVFKATGAESNTDLQAAQTTYNNSTGSAMVIHKAVPQVVVGTPSNKLGATSVLHTATVSAVGDDIGLYRVSYEVTTSTGVSVSNGYLSLKSCTGCGGVSNGRVSATSNGTLLNDTTASFSFAMSSAQLGGSKTYLSIAEGASAVLEFIATIGLTTNSDTVSTSLLGDTATTTNDTTGDPAAAFTANNQGNFVWSDLNLSTANSSTGTDAKQWYNGYLVSGLGTVATGTPVTVGE